jgi:hypothetical protein
MEKVRLDDNLTKEQIEAIVTFHLTRTRQLPTYY